MGSSRLAPSVSVERYRVQGMTCGSCVSLVRQALLGVAGVEGAAIDAKSGIVVVERHREAASPDALRSAVAQAGFQLDAPDATPSARGPVRRILVSRRSVAFGALAALALLGLYLGLATIAQGWDHALALFAEDAALVIAIVAGFGLQVGLFFHLRTLHARASGHTLAASGGTSTATMLACCVHHLADVAPFIGLAGIATILGAYKVPLLWLGLTGNVIGSAYLIREVRRCASHGVTVVVGGPATGRATGPRVAAGIEEVK